jgi:hypothetical protein
MQRSSLVSYASPLLFSVMLAHACAPAVADAPGATGTASEVRTTDAFRGIEIAGTIEVEARIGPARRVEVIGEPDRIKQVLTSVAGGVLRIDTKGKLGRSRLRVVVTAPALETFSISGTGELRATGLDGGTIDATIAGTGAMQLAGKAAALRLSIPGTGEVRAGDLVVTGAIRVHGRPPTVKKSISGTGIVDVH